MFWIWLTHVLHPNNAPDSSETRHASGVLFAVRIIVHAQDWFLFSFMFLDRSFGF